MRSYRKFLPIFFAVFLHVPLTSAAESPVLEGNERQQYLDSIMQLQAVQDERSALLAQINLLLKEHALLSGYQVGYRNPQDIVYSISVVKHGELSIREQTRTVQTGQLQVRSRTINVFGMSSSFGYDCFANKVDCIITHSGSSTPLLRIARQPNIAQELAQALSYLVRDMQRN